MSRLIEKGALRTHSAKYRGKHVSQDQIIPGPSMCGIDFLNTFDEVNYGHKQLGS
jgi:hypothetical protein